MNNKEIDLIINNYKPHQGFFDLSEEPENLTKEKYAKILNIQNFLIEENKQKKYLMKYNPIQWGETKELAGRLQGIILRYWEFDNEHLERKTYKQPKRYNKK